jgi:hypothetical protein
MTLRIPNQGEAAMLGLVTSVAYACRLFTNHVHSGLDATQINALDESDFTEATFAGYAAVTLTAGAWTTAEGNPSTVTYNSTVSFIRSSTGTDEPQYGYYVTRSSDGLLMWYEYFDETPAAVSIDTAGEQIDVVPALTGADTSD